MTDFWNRAEAQAAKSDSDASYDSFLWGFGGPAWRPRGNTGINYESKVDVSASSILTAVLEVYAEVGVEAPWSLLDMPKGVDPGSAAGAEGEKVVAHPSLDLLRQPNPYYDGESLLASLIVDLEATGNAYCIVAGRRGSDAAQLWWAPSWTMEPIGRDEYGAPNRPHRRFGRRPENPAFIWRYRYQPMEDGEFLLPVESVIHIRGRLNPYNPRVGISKLYSLMREFFTDSEATNFTAQLLSNVGVPGTVIAPVGTDTIPPGVREELQTRYKQGFTNDGRGQVMVIGHPVNVQPLSFSPSAMNLSELHRLPEQRISGVFKVPAIIAGLGAGLDSSTYNNLQGLLRFFYERSIIPLQKRMARAMTRQLLYRYWPDMEDAGTRLEFDTSAVQSLVEDEETRNARWLARLGAGAATLAEIREAFGMEVEEKTDHVFYLPGGVQPVPRDLIGAGAPEEPEPANMEDDPAQPPEKPDDDAAPAGASRG